VVFTPRITQVKRFYCQLIKEVWDNYDIDAIHFDDIFTHIKCQNGISRQSHYDNTKKPGPKPRDDWRKTECHELIFALNRRSNRVSLGVQFGISLLEFGRIKDQRPERSPNRRRTDQLRTSLCRCDSWMKKTAGSIT